MEENPGLAVLGSCYHALAGERLKSPKARTFHQELYGHCEAPAQDLVTVSRRGACLAGSRFKEETQVSQKRSGSSIFSPLLSSRLSFDPSR